MNKHSHRKDEHFSLAEKFHQSNFNNDFDAIRFIHQSLPETDFKDINTKINLGPLNLKWPFYIEAMTGGSKRTGLINKRLSQIAKKTDLAIASGSQSIALSYPQLNDTFNILRTNNPNGIVIGNIGASHNLDDAKKAIKMLKADALEIHVNVTQELIMPEGKREFHWLDNIKNIVSNISIPVIIKEVGFGMSKETIHQLYSIGVKYVNVSGRGGTNFAQIENFRRKDKELTYLNNWGQTTVESLLEASTFNSKLNVIASGGIRNALDIAKALALGANSVGIAGTILHSLIHNGDDNTIKMIKEWQHGLKIIMTMLGCRNIEELRNTKMLFSNDLMNYINQRKLK